MEFKVGKMRGGMLRYRCRMCGEEFQNIHVPDVPRAVSAIVLSFPDPWPGGMPLPRLVETHYHKNGSGVADLIGGVVDAEYMEWGAVMQFKECGKCGQAGDSVSYESQYGQGLICQRCRDEEINQAAQNAKATEGSK